MVDEIGKCIFDFVWFGVIEDMSDDGVYVVRFVILIC